MAKNLLTIAILSGLILVVVVVTNLLGVRLFDRIAINLCIGLVLVLGLQVFMGNSGILSFARIGFMGIGAYTTAVLTIPIRMKGMSLPDLYPIIAGIELSPYIAILIGGLVAAAVAAAVSYPLMRLSDAAAVITSFALLVVLHTVLTHWSEMTNGPRTLFGLPRATDLNMAAGAAILAVVAAVAFKESRTGLLLRSSRDDEVAAAAMGAHIPRLRWQAFILSALFAGIGGALWGHFITSFSPKAFFLKETFVILGMLVIGGANTVTGAVFGTIIVTVAFESLRALESGINQTQIFSEQVVGIYSGKVTWWEELGGSRFKAYPVAREPGDSSRRVIEEHIPGLKDIEITPRAKTAYSTPEAVKMIKGHKNTIGYLPMAMAHRSGLRVLKLDGIYPSVENVRNGTYPLSAPLSVVHKEKLRPVARKFVDFLFGSVAIAVIKKYGCVPEKRKQ